MNRIPLKDNSHLIPSNSILKKIRLSDVVHTELTMVHVTREQYYECTQHDHKQFDWDGFFIRYGMSSGVPVSGYVALKKRRPSARMDLPRVIVNELSAMTFGDKKFPSIMIDGDCDADDYVNELCRISKLPSKILEARNNGGANGTAVMSWGFVNGKPVIEVHRRSQVDVLEWADYEERRPAEVIKAYTYSRRVYDKEGKPKQKIFYYARYWNEHVDICWRDIPEEIGVTNKWWMMPSKSVVHEYELCPVYWIQNNPDSDDIDGIGDYIDGSHTNFDEIDKLLSATTKGTTANVDPTLVVHANQSENKGVLRKGSENAIYSEKGASYLELTGTSIETALKVLEKLRQIELDKAGVVILDQEKTGGTALSASAMRQRYARMIARVDILRTQYECAIITILSDMLEVARFLETKPVQTADGGQIWSRVMLPPRVEKVEDEKNDDEIENRHEKNIIEVERTPGISSNITVTWPPYFEPNWTDKKDAIETVNKATNKQQVLSQRKAVNSIAPLFGIDDTDQELGEIDEDKKRQIKRTQELMEAGAPNQFGKPQMGQKNDKSDDKEVRRFPEKK